MRNIFVATGIVLFVVILAGWAILKQGTTGKGDGVSRQIETTKNSPPPTVNNTIRHSNFTPVTSQTNAGPSNGIRSYSQEKSQWKGLKNTATRSRKVALAPMLLDNTPEENGSRLSLQLFDDVRIEAEVSGSFTNIKGTVSTTAGVLGSRFGRMFIAKTDDELRAKIILPEAGKLYAIHYNPADKTHYTIEMDLKADQIDDVGEHPVAPLAQNDQLIRNLEFVDSPTMQSDESVASTVVDIMIVYSNDALSHSGSLSNVDNLIALAMMHSNDAFTNTETGIVLNLVHSQQVNYDGLDNTNTDLENLTNTSDGHIDNVHALRSTYGADFVCLMVGDYASDGGVAWQLTSTNGNSSYAFSVVTQPAMDSYTPAHELGHNMGLAHARDQNIQPGPTTWSTDAYGFGTTTAGWHWHPTGGADGYCTVMPYTSGNYYDDGLDHIRIGLFSDPGKTDNGMPIGDDQDGDNARVLRAMKSVYEAYKTRSLPDNTIVVDSPGGGEYWTAEETHAINWYEKDVTGNVTIELYKNGSFHSTISTGTLNDHAYAWTIPPGNYGSGFRIRITSIDNASIVGESDADFIIATPFYKEPLDNNPGYETTGQWEFGEPLSDNMTYGGPGSAYTGDTIYDTDLDSTYTSTSYLTSTVVDCTAYREIRLRCMAQISVSSDTTASIQVSSDGSTWSDLYSESDLWQAEWTPHEYDISAIADGQSSVYIRWAIDHTQGSLRSGFAVDDILITGVRTMPSMRISDVTVTEGDAGSANADFTVSLDEASANTITVDYATTGNTATSDTDFTADSGTVTFSPGDVSKTITVAVQGDTIYEADESYYVNLSSPENVTIADNQGVGTITDDDTAPTVTLHVDTDTISEAGGIATITATLSNETAETVTVDLGYTGTADGSDYTASAASIMIASGTTGDATVTAISDAMFESNETIVIDITGVTNAGENGIQQQTTTIADDDNAPTVSMRADTGSITEAGGIATITATLSNETSETVTISLGYTGSAEDSDYTTSVSSIVISNGTTGTATITAIEDSMIEGDEIVMVEILTVTNGTDNGAPPLTITIADDIAGDYDGDGMPNGWEVANGLDPAINDSADDPDGDGYTNLQEYLADTNPQACNPIADAGPDQTVTQGVFVSLSARNSSDADGGIDTYLWEQIAGSSVSLSDGSAAAPAFTAPDNSSEALIFELTITDNDNLTDTDTCIVNVTGDENKPPTAVTGPDQIAEEGRTVSLEGSDSRDPEDGTPVAWLWEQTSGTSVSLSDIRAVAPVFSAPAAGTQVLAFTLIVTDSEGLKDTDQCLVNIASGTSVLLPTADAGSDQTVEEGMTVTLNGSDSSEPEADVPSMFQWTQTNGLPVILSDASTVKPSFVAPSVDVITEDLTFTLTVTDNKGLKHSDQCVVSVTNVSNDNSPPTADAGHDQIVEEKQTVTLDGSGSADPDDGTLSSWHWTQTGGLPVILSDASAVKPSFIAPSVDVEGTVLGFQLMVTDSTGLESTDVMRVTVNDVGTSQEQVKSSEGGGSSCFIDTLNDP